MSLEEYRALRERAGVSERADAGRLAVAGGDRLTYLHAMLTNDIASLKPGKGCYSAYLTPQGRMISDMRVLELGELALVVLPLAVRDEVQSKLEQFVFSEDVKISDLTANLADIRVVGPEAPKVVAAAFGEDRDSALQALGSLDDCASMRGSFGGAQLVVTADRTLGVPAFDVFIDRDKFPPLVSAFTSAGAVGVADAALDTLRIEAGLPRFGVDMEETTIPLEAGIEGRAISFTKGCYPGQEVITRVVHRGHGRVARKLVGVVVDGQVPPQRGDAFRSDDSDIGKVTSAVMSPLLGVPIALGYVQRDFTEPGTAVWIDRAGTRLAARVVGLPFVR